MALTSPSRTRHRRLTRFSNHVRMTIVLSGLCFFAVFLFFSETKTNLFEEHHPLRVWVFDVGQGDAIFVETPEGRQVLIDSGPDQEVLNKLGSVLSPWDRTIDDVLLTHPHEDHLAGFVELLKRYDVETVYETGVLSSSPTYKVFSKVVKEENANHIFVHSGMEISLEKNISLRILAPDQSLTGTKLENLNMASIVVELIYGETSILLTGDAPFEEEEDLWADMIVPIDILKVAHHGSGASTSQHFLEVTHPRETVISVGEGNDYGHPHPVLLKRLQEIGTHIWRTDQDGDILIISFGGEPEIQSNPLPF